MQSPELVKQGERQIPLSARMKEVRGLHTYPLYFYILIFYLRFAAASSSDAAAVRKRFLDSFRMAGVTPSKRANVPPPLSCTPPLKIIER